MTYGAIALPCGRRTRPFTIPPFWKKLYLSPFLQLGVTANEFADGRLIPTAFLAMTLNT